MTNRTVQVGTQPAWWCIEIGNTEPPMTSDDTKRRPVAMLFAETGCRPRLACVEVRRRSDAVIQYRVGRQVTWPVTSRTTGADTICSDEMFTDDNAAAAAVQPRVLVSRRKYGGSSVPCGIDAWYYLNGSNSSGHHLEGYVDACGSDATSFRYVTGTPSSEPDDESSATSEETHRCLGNFTERSAAAEITYIITDAGPVSNPNAAQPRFFCWLLEKSVWLKTPRLYLTYAADCHSETGVRISYESHTGYIAQFDLIASSGNGHEWIRNCSTSSRQKPADTTVGLRRMTTQDVVVTAAVASTAVPADVTPGPRKATTQGALTTEPASTTWSARASDDEDSSDAIIAASVVAATVVIAVVVIIVVFVIRHKLTSGQYTVHKP